LPRLPLPTSCTLWPTSACNLNCSYCFVYKLYKVKHDVMSKDRADEALSFLERTFPPDRGLVWFFGGEPLLAWDVVKYVAETVRARGYGWTVGATTNATVITEERARWMGRIGFGLNISLDGDEALHDRYRKFPDGRGSWRYVWQSIKHVRRYVNPNPQIRWTVFPDPEVLERVPEVFKWFLDQGLTSVAMDFVYEVRVDEDLLKHIKKFFERYIAILDAYYAAGVRPFSMFVRDAWEAVRNREAGVRANWMFRCGLAQGDFAIAPDGALYPCHRFVSSGEVRVGDVRKGFNPERLYFNERWWKMRPYSQDPELCMSCRYRWACTGGCLAMNYDLFGDTHVVPRTLCLIKDLNVEVFKPFVFKWRHVLEQQYGKATPAPW